MFDTMSSFDSGGVEINYIVEGDGPPVVLVHGFASSLQGNWRATGVIPALVAAGRKAVALDCRGHGRSGKPHDPEAYGGTKMPDDVIALMDHLGIGRADLIGYSMGGFIAASLMVRRPERFSTVILSGVGDARMLGNAGRERATAIAEAMEAPDKTAVKNASARAFREFAELSGNDLRALAAMQRSASRSWFDPAKLSEVALPVMVLVGAEDTLVGPPDRLAAAIPNATLVRVPGDHLTAPAMPQFRGAIVNFLKEHSPVPPDTISSTT
jgi:pimeloyl-ACP methyl ester carboxylesterase